MRYIRSCPSCSTELRFPLDMGILIITCPTCKTAFKMDPDDSDTYLSGSFDLSPSKKSFPLRIPGVLRSIQYFNSPKDIRFLIPILLLALLILHLFKIFNSIEEDQNGKMEKEQQEFFRELEPDGQDIEEKREDKVPSFEI